MISISSLVTLASIAASFATLAIVLLIYLRNRRSEKYDYENQRAIINILRDSYEKKIYDYEERLMSSRDRWMDANHLLVRSQELQEDSILPNSTFRQSRFIKAAGLGDEDFQIDRKQVFVLTPYNERYLDTFEIIRNVCLESGLKCIRGDEEHFTSDFLSHVLRQIARSAVIVANVDGRSPNVYYELGICHALDKKTILISKSIKNLPADIKSKGTLIYEDDLELKDQLRRDLLKVLTE